MFQRATKEIHHHHIVEVDKPHGPLPEMTNDLKESLKTLANQPAFQYLLQRLKLERAELQRQLEKGFQLNEQQLHFLQAGVYYTGWLEGQLAKLTFTPRAAQREPSLDEAALFEQHQASLEVIG